MTDYESIRAVNWSSLRHLHAGTGGSPLLYRWRIDNPRPDTAAFQLGRAVHCAVLEPDEFASRYAVYPGPVRRGKQWDAWLEDHAGVETLTAAEMDAVGHMSSAVHASEPARSALAGGAAEQVVRWTDADTGLECKGRLDLVRPDGLVDLKTARDVDPRRFATAVAQHLYHGQLAWYHAGAAAAKVIDDHALPPRWVVVQSQEPWDVAVYEPSEEMLGEGHALRRSLMRQLLACSTADYWPGVSPVPTTIELPRWAVSEETCDE